ncbi:NAD(P)/FAD-dependent oxidoreductase [Gallaecimonas xiamenensis]|uniref:Respiratory NADH dehydrogenase 2, cupric reductase n=1 Tax=Gallaecimonas xiamenensis 3-C-1 TaxID=745411 RepID=K2ID72_9GAMM|nr:NAD(P)/FAD-dependent oxidoreductase [Gallaecimonas xiamenensis]EKE67926.1 respiratory NADH dehydrogenase 2, cupric reductase [Gallaecimonas xiamenensis 3-C-1]
MKRIVIVGGGAGGLELACRLGRSVGKKHLAQVLLIDQHRQHVWKPLLHEVATGSFNPELGGADYLNLARLNGFQFVQGQLTELDRDNRQLTLAPTRDGKGRFLTRNQQLHYDLLVMAVGSQSADFGTPGVADHAFFLDGPEQANVYHDHLLAKVQQQTLSDTPQQLSIAIVGAGATGVELSAELHSAERVFRHYGAKHLSLDLTLLEAGPRILPALNERIAAKAQRELNKLGVKVRTSAKVVEATKDAFVLEGDERVEADLLVWAAGIKGADWVGQLGLEVSRRNQLVVNGQLRTSDEHIYALGDCCDAAPPRAQAANQQAIYLNKCLGALIKGERFDDSFVYQDYGSLVSLAEHSAVGGLMGSLAKGTLFVEGHLARWMYISLYRKHQLALFGFWRTLGLMIADKLNGWVRPRLKLH